MDNQPNEEDKKFIRKCIELSDESLKKGENPFGSLITKDGKILVEAVNGAKDKVNNHAEIIALNKASEALGTSNLAECTLYTNCEPCPMCSFMIREHKIKKVVFALASPFMGGYTKWDILQDKELEKFEPYFGKPPEVVACLLEKEAKEIFDKTPLWMFGSDVKV